MVTMYQHSGQNVKEEPFIELDDVRRLRISLRNKPRDQLLFDLATLTGAPIRHILGLKIREMRKAQTGERLTIGAKNAALETKVPVNDVLCRVIKDYLQGGNFKDDDFVFKSRKGSQSLRLSSASRIIKGWFEAVDIPGSGGALFLRKIWQTFYKNGLPSMGDATGDEEEVTLRRIQVKTAQQTVLKELERAIASGRIPPGHRLTIEEVARQVGVSRIPVREAFVRLEERGLITTVPKKGSIVNELSVEQFEEILELRLINESIAARKAAKNRTEETIKDLERIHERYLEAIRSNKVSFYLQANKEFHHTIYRAANMPILMSFIEHLWDRIAPYLQLLMSQKDVYDPMEDIEFHRGMLAGITKGDPDELAYWLQADLKEAAKLIGEWFSVFKES